MKANRIHQFGVSLIELMISITIGVVILAAILAVYSATSATSKQSETNTRMSEDAAIALNYIAGYIRMSGFSVPQANVPANTAVVGTATVQTIESNFTGTGIRGCDNGFSNPTVASALSLACNAGAGSGAISLRFEGDTSSTTPSGANPTDCLNQAITGLTTSDYEASLNYKLVESRFFVKTGLNSGTPELYCAGNGSGAFVPQPIMQYVENLVFVYGVGDDVSSRQAASYLTAADVDALPGTDADDRWARVVSVKICLVMRSELPDQNGPSTYRNCAGTVVGSPNNFSRRSFQTVVTLRNRGGFSSS